MREALQVVLSKRFLLRKSQSYASQSVQLLKCSNIQLFTSQIIQMMMRWRFKNISFSLKRVLIQIQMLSDVGQQIVP